MQISQKYKEEIINEIKDLSDDQIASVMKIIRIFKESIIRQKEYDFVEIPLSRGHEQDLDLLS